MLLQNLLLFVSWVLLLGAGWFVWQLFRQNGRILLRLDALEEQLQSLSTDRSAAPTARPSAPVPAGLRPGSEAPDFAIPDLSGATRTLSEWTGQPVLLVFFDPKCGFCHQMAPALAGLPSPAPGNGPVLVLITRGSVDESGGLVQKHGLQCPVLIEPEGSETARRYQARGTPMGYLIDAQGRIASELAIGAEALLSLANEGKTAPARLNGSADPDADHAHRGNRPLSESRINRSGLPPGTAAPDFRLPLLTGGEVALSDYRGRQTLLVFSDPNCGPCDQLAPHLEAASLEASGPRILFVSRGDEEANRQKADRLGLTLPIALQRQWEVSKQFGMFATPIAYLIDAAGSIEAEVAVGVEPILKLLGKGNAARPVVPASAAKEAAPTRT